MQIQDFLLRLRDGEFDETLTMLYGAAALAEQKQRYVNAVAAFTALYPKRTEIHIFSAPGRTEIGGNHTDHQHGCTLAAAVNLDAIAVVAFHEESVIRFKSAGYARDIVELSDLCIHPGECGSASMIRGIASRFAEMGASISGFDAYSTSDVLSGSGISSSAAFETLVGTIINAHDFGGKASAVEIAKIGQYAENVYFGKKSGLLDQTVSSVGGFVYIDFHDTEEPHIKRYTFSFEDVGYCLCITDTKGSHADLTEDYVAVPQEMCAIAKELGVEVLRDADEDAFYHSLPQLRQKCGDRAVMRAIHFFEENRRAGAEARALERCDMDAFLRLVQESGDSSECLLQNLYSCRKPTEQAIPLGIYLSKKALCGKGAVRVHGGGFAGTIQAFVPLEMKESYCTAMDTLFGEGSCHTLRIRPVGGMQLI